MPLLGGLGVMVAVFLTLLLDAQTERVTLAGNLSPGILLGIFFASMVIALGGILDDKYVLRASRQIVFPVIATIIVMWSGVKVTQITNPFGGAFQIELWQPLTFIWLMGMTYTTKLLDGVDGLATSITAVGALMIALLAASTTYYQPDMVRLAMIFFGALLGFLFWNGFPAKIYLGEAGSEFLGFFLGLLAIISGSKIATTLLVIGIPALDILAVMATRAYEGRPIFSGDRIHLHHRLQSSGLSPRMTVAVMTTLSAAFGLTTLFLQSRQKIVALVVLALVMIGLLAYTRRVKNELS